MRFDGQVAVITGAGRGIGRAHAMLLAERGAQVVVNDLGADVSGRGSAEGPATQVVDEIQRAGGSAVADINDVSTRAGAESVIETALERFGRIDVLVHNAGFNVGPLQPVFDVHVAAAWWLVERAWTSMVDQAYGRVVLTTSASVFGDGTGPGENPKQAYSTSKAGVIGLTTSLAARGRPVGITVNALLPAAYSRLTEMNRNIGTTRPGAKSGEEVVEWAKANSPASLVAAGALWMMHASCELSGSVFAVGSGRISEIFFGATRGYVAPSAETTPEDFRAHLAEARDRGGFCVPRDMYDYSAFHHSVLAETKRASGEI